MVKSRWKFRRVLLCTTLCVAALDAVLMLKIHADAAAREKLSVGEARRLIANFAGATLPKDAVEIRKEDISVLGSTATVVAKIATAFRFDKGSDGEWRVAEVRAGDNRWEDVELLRRALDAEKTARARAELDSIATALEAFRRERGHYVVAEDARALLDNLSPRYLPHVIRLDPWHKPYAYEGTATRYRLRSPGADGEEHTGDDVAVNN